MSSTSKTWRNMREITDTKNLRSGDWIKEKEVRFNLFV